MKAVAATKPVVRRSSGNVFEDVGFPKPEAERLRIMAPHRRRVDLEMVWSLPLI